MTRPPLDPNTAQAGSPDASDADWQSLVDYLSKEGTPSERALVEQRLATDAPFATFAESVTRIWQIPLTRPPRDLEAGWAAIQRSAAAFEESAASGSSPTASIAPSTVTPSTVTPSTVTPSTATPPAATPPAATPPAARRRAQQIPLSFLYSSSWSNRWSVKRSLATFALSAMVAVVAVLAVHKQRWPSYQYQGGLTGSTISLPDGSIATLAPNSYLGTEPGFPKHNRTLHLFGAAQFAVVHNTRIPFIVHVPGVGARVLGTTFAMQVDTMAHVHVDVTDGKISLETQDSQGRWRPLAVLTSGQTIHVLIMAQWMAQAGYEVARAGVPILKAYPIEQALRRSLIRAGAAASADKARRDSITRSTTR